MLLSYALIDDQLMEVAEKSEVLDFDEHYIGKEFAHRCRNVVPNPEDLKDKEWVAAHLHLRNDTSIRKTRKPYFGNKKLTLLNSFKSWTIFSNETYRNQGASGLPPPDTPHTPTLLVKSIFDNSNSERIQNLVKYLRLSFLQRQIQDKDKLLVVKCFSKTLHSRCFIGF